MNFEYDDEQRFLSDSVRKFLDARCGSAVVRGVLDDPERSYDAELWKQVADQGWLGVSIPEEYGGLGLSQIELCVIAEEIGRALAPIPFSSTVYFVAGALLRLGSPEQKRRWLPGIARGEVIGCFATAEGPGPLSRNSIGARVTDGALSGTKLPVVDGAAAGLAVVLAREEGSPKLFLVEIDHDSVTRDVVETIDPSRKAAKLSFRGTPAERLGLGGDGFKQAQSLLEHGAALLAFEQIGGADRALEMALDYAQNRYIFGRTLSSYQAMKHKLADVYVKNQLARSHAYFGAWALNSSPGDLPLAAAAARVAASNAYWHAAKENLQTHGGIGYTWEIDVHLHYRRSRHLALVAEPPQLWEDRLVEQLELRNQHGVQSEMVA